MYDPANLARWSPLMAMAWIASRDLALVAKFHPDSFDVEPTLMRLTVALALRVRQAEADTLGGTGAAALDEIMGAAASERLLLGAMTDGSADGPIAAFGVPPGGSLPVPIPAHEWEVLSVRETGDDVGTRLEHEPAYRQVRIDRRALLARFPAHPDAIMPDPRASANPAAGGKNHIERREILRRIVAILKAEYTGPDGLPTNTQHAIRANLRGGELNKDGLLSVRLFNEAWKEAGGGPGWGAGTPPDKRRT